MFEGQFYVSSIFEAFIVEWNYSTGSATLLRVAISSVTFYGGSCAGLARK